MTALKFSPFIICSMNVMYASDENYAWLMGISMISLFENNRERDEIVVFLFNGHMSADSEQELRDAPVLVFTNIL